MAAQRSKPAGSLFCDIVLRGPLSCDNNKTEEAVSFAARNNPTCKIDNRSYGSCRP